MNNSIKIKQRNKCYDKYMLALRQIQDDTDDTVTVKVAKKLHCLWIECVICQSYFFII